MIRHLIRKLAGVLLRPLVRILGTSLVLVGAVIMCSTSTSAASPGDVIINELQYNPGTANQNDEFIELYNTTASPIDLGGWSFSAGITLTTTTFTAGTIIPAGGYLIVSPNAAQTMTTYGVVSSAEYAPSNLSNGGETITLIDDSTNVISSVTYDDVAPWPTSPDGTGPSLELKGTGLDNTIPTNWGASTSSGGTPLATNSQVGLNLPTITSVTDPNNITASQTVDITATVTGTGITSVTLSYKLNFDTDITLTMYDDGTHNDGAAGDDVYGAQIPGQAEKTLVRFKIEATNASGTQASPSIDDSMDYHGYYVKDPSVTSDAPILEWFISDTDYNDLLANHRYDNVYVPCVIIYNDEVYDNSAVRARGDYRDDPKLPVKIKLPSGYEFDIAGGDPIPAREFELLNHLYSTPALAPSIIWMTKQTGLPASDLTPVYVQKNGEFQGLYMYANKYQKQWRDYYGYSNGELYEDTFGEIVNGANDFSNMQNLFDNTFSTTDIHTQTQKDFVLDSFDIPKTFNFMAAVGLVSGWDHASFNNTLQYFDKTTNRWSSLLWDQNGTFKNTPGMSAYDGRGSNLNTCFYVCPVYNQLELRELYFRRMRTLVDQLYANNSFANQATSLDAQYANDQAIEEIKWPIRDSGYQLNALLGGISRQKDTFLNFMTGFDWALPPAQTDADRQSVSLAEVVTDSNDANEYIRLYNTANTPVDLSNWTIEGINYTIPAGSVIPANGSLYLLRDDIGYRASHAAVLVAGQYSNDLGSNGSLTLKTDTGATIDMENY